ncbi:hypothetical protein BDR05DRAFT_997062 [Suillus weaverae]|nr:hypothetical protein BDR05DRAFT_997062 [Suillus weaverae]
MIPTSMCLMMGLFLGILDPKSLISPDELFRANHHPSFLHHLTHLYVPHDGASVRPHHHPLFHITSHTHLPRKQADYQDLTKVEARIIQLTDTVQELKEMRNSLTPLFKLSGELVIMVLSLLVAGDEPDAHSLVSCSQVCCRMQQICLESPSLWRDAMNMSASPKFMVMILPRSTPLPFSIAIDFAQWNAEDP